MNNHPWWNLRIIEDINPQEPTIPGVYWWNNFKVTYQISKCKTKEIRTTQYYPVMPLKDQAREAERRNRNIRKQIDRLKKQIIIKDQYRKIGGNSWGGLTIPELIRILNASLEEAKRIPVLTG